MKPGHSTPLDKTAALVVGKGVHHEYSTHEGNRDSPLPLGVKEFVVQPDTVDLSGLRVGRVLVIGPSVDFNQRWVCRCDCGTYVVRKSKGLKQGVAVPCGQCHMLALAKKKEYIRRTGRFDRECEDFL